MTDDGAMDQVACGNPRCPFGVEGAPRLFVPARSWSRFCCKSCRMVVAGTRRRALDGSVVDEPGAGDESLPDSATTTDAP